MKKKAPACPASSARLMVPCPLITITSSPWSMPFSARSTSMPSASGSSRSSNTTAGCWRAAGLLRPEPEFAVDTR